MKIVDIIWRQWVYSKQVKSADYLVIGFLGNSLDWCEWVGIDESTMLLEPFLLKLLLFLLLRIHKVLPNNILLRKYIFVCSLVIVISNLIDFYRFWCFITRQIVLMLNFNTICKNILYSLISALLWVQNVATVWSLDSTHEYKFFIITQITSHWLRSPIQLFRLVTTYIIVNLISIFC